MNDSHYIQGMCPHCKCETRLYVPHEWWVPVQCSSCGQKIQPEDWDKVAAVISQKISSLTEKLGCLKKNG